MLKALRFYLLYFSTRKRLKEVWAPYLIKDKGSVTLSFLRKTISIKNFSLQALSAKDEMIEFINQGFPWFKADSCSIGLREITFRSSRLPHKYSLPKRYRWTRRVIPIGCNEHRELIEINTPSYSSIGLFIPSGFGKTTYLKSLLRVASRNDYYFFKTVIIDPKNDGDFDEFRDTVKIINSLRECHEFLVQLSREIEAGEHKPHWIIFEEFHQYTDKSKYSNKDESKIAGEVAKILETALQLWRSKGVFWTLTTQNLNITASPIDLENVRLKIFGAVSRSQAQINNIPAQYTNRDDFRNGKFLLWRDGRTEIIRGFSND